jgi:hypothetical protein
MASEGGVPAHGEAPPLDEVKAGGVDAAAACCAMATSAARWRLRLLSKMSS